ncbi:MAG: two-component regulator propeller domain-containing protein, partial [Acidobacteriota bacterium]
MGPRVDLSSPRARRARPGKLRCLVAGFGSLAALALGPAAAARGEPRFERLDSEDGLSQMNVLDIAQDETGFMWFVTQDGLNRYDGSSFRYFPAPVGTLWPGPDRALWIGSDRGLFRLDRVRESLEKATLQARDPQDGSDLAIYDLIPSRRGGAWLATVMGAHYLDAEIGALTPPLGLPTAGLSAEDSRSRTLFEDADGALLMSVGELLFRRPENTSHFEPYEPCPGGPGVGEVSAMLRTRGGELLVGGERGFDRVSADGASCRRLRPDPQDPTSLVEGPISDFLEDRAGTLWIAVSRGGLLRWRGEGEGFTRYRREDGGVSAPASNFFTTLYEDAIGAVWAGLAPGGVHLFDPAAGSFTTTRVSESLAARFGADIVTALVEAEDGEVWVGSYLGLWRRRADGEIDLSQPIAGDLEAEGVNQIHALHLEEEVALWIGTRSDGLARLDLATGELEQMRHDPEDPQSLISDQVRSIARGPRGALWIGTRGGISRLEPENQGPRSPAGGPRRFVALPSSTSGQPELSSPDVRYLHFHGESLWVATFGGGIHRLDLETGQIAGALRHDPDDPASLPSDSVRSVFVDSRGALWASLDGAGVSRSEDGGARFERFTVASGLPNNVVHGALEDGLGRIWVSTNGGLACFDPETEAWTRFDEQDGLQYAEFNFGAFHRGPSGRLYFGGLRGFNDFRGEDFPRRPRKPTTVLTSLSGLGFDLEPPRAAPFTDVLELRHDQNAFFFEFATLSFLRGDKNRFRYRLDGFDERWIDAEDRNFASYTNVPPGRYRLRVQGAGESGVWSPADSLMEVRVASQPWRTPFAYGLYLFALIGMAAGLARRQRLEVEKEREINRRLREVDRIKDEFLANTSHELRTPLFGITGLAESMVDGVHGDLPPEVIEDLGMIVASGHRLASLVNDILDFSKLDRGGVKLRPQSVDLRGLVEGVLSLSRPLVGDQGVLLLNHVPRDAPPVWADEERLQQILLNLIGNAIKFTPKGRIQVTASRAGERVEVSVADTGIGIASENLEKIFGAFEQADASIERSFGL